MEVIKKHKEMKEVEIIDEHYTKCDKCGGKIQTNCYDAFEFEFKRKTGESFPEGGSGEEETLDLCQDCSEQAINLLKENGYNVQFNEWDW